MRKGIRVSVRGMEGQKAGPWITFFGSLVHLSKEGQYVEDFLLYLEGSFREAL